MTPAARAMKQLLSLTMSSVVCSIVLAGCSQRTVPSRASGEAEEDAKQVMTAETAYDLANQIRARLLDARTEDLDELVASPDTGLALAAGWERLLRTPRRQKLSHERRARRKAISRFLELVRARTGVELPRAWKKAVRSVRLVPDPRVNEYSGFDMAAAKRGRGATGEPATTFHRDGERWIVERGGSRWSIPARGAMGHVEAGTAMLDGDMAYIVLHGMSPGSYLMDALDRTGRIVWSSKVWAGGDLAAWCGSPVHHDVTLVPGANRIIVFGVTCAVAYVEAFDRKTGAPAFRFCTRYVESLDD